MSILEEVKCIKSEISELKNLIKDLKKDNDNYLTYLSKEFGENRLFDIKFEEGTYPPHKNYLSDNYHPCTANEGPFPHLYHTFNPQLNNMTDMLRQLLDCACGTKHREIIDHLEDAKNRINDLTDFSKSESKELPKEVIEIIDRLKEITEKLNQKQCITIEDLKQHFQTRSQERMKIQPPIPLIRND